MSDELDDFLGEGALSVEDDLVVDDPTAEIGTAAWLESVVADQLEEATEVPADHLGVDDDEMDELTVEHDDYEEEDEDPIEHEDLDHSDVGSNTLEPLDDDDVDTDVEEDVLGPVEDDEPTPKAAKVWEPLPPGAGIAPRTKRVWGGVGVGWVDAEEGKK